MYLPDTDENDSNSPESRVRLAPHDTPSLEVVRQLAVEYWRAGEIARAVVVLEEAIAQADASARPGLLNVLWKILFEKRLFNQAAIVAREEVECRVDHDGPFHPESLLAQGDLALVLFELGAHAEAETLQRTAFENAGRHLGSRHPVTSVLAWNQLQTAERRRDCDTARRLAIDQLSWLLAEDEARLTEDQREIRAGVAERLNWDATPLLGRAAIF